MSQVSSTFIIGSDQGLCQAIFVFNFSWNESFFFHDVADQLGCTQKLSVNIILIHVSWMNRRVRV